MRSLPQAIATYATWSLAIPLLGILIVACNEEDDSPTVPLETVPPLIQPTDTPSGDVTSPIASPTATLASIPTETPTATMTLAPTATQPPTATATPEATSTPTPSPTPEPTATETATPVPPTPTTTEGSVVITSIIFDPPTGRDGDGETVTIANVGESPVDMTGWTLSDIAEHTYTFPEFVLQPGAAVVVHICTGDDTHEILFWGRCSAIWNNDGDTAYLRDATGREISTYSY